MNILVQGITFSNKGSHLMLVAIMQQIDLWDLNANFCVSLRQIVAAKKSGLNLGFAPLFYSLKYPLLDTLMNSFLKLFPRSIRSRLGITLFEEIDVLIDASGLAYSDQITNSREFTCLIKKYMVKSKRQSQKIIFMPQAFGPFGEFDNSCLRCIIEQADLVYSRDPISLHELCEFTHTEIPIKLSPDFTHTVLGMLPAYLNNYSGEKYVCIVPNVRMLTDATAAERASYLPFLRFCIAQVLNCSYRVVVLIHETKSDSSLIRDIYKDFGESILLIEESDPMYVKGILGSSYLVIGSRYHSLVSALSQGVPCIGTSWNHKYLALFDDFNCSEYLISDFSDLEDVSHKIRSLLDENAHLKMIKNLVDSYQFYDSETQKMWYEIKEVLLS